MAACATLTPGETACAVVITPKTAQGWRPISVKIQPNELATSGSSGRAIASHSQTRPRGTRPLRVPTRIAAAAAAAARPSPIISRKDQYVIGMTGV